MRIQEKIQYYQKCWKIEKTINLILTIIIATILLLSILDLTFFNTSLQSIFIPKTVMITIAMTLTIHVITIIDVVFCESCLFTAYYLKIKESNYHLTLQNMYRFSKKNYEYNKKIVQLEIASKTKSNNNRAKKLINQLNLKTKIIESQYETVEKICNILI